jgi:hypothetical protein
MTGAIVVHGFIELKRVVAVHEVTEEDVYKEGQVPTTYGGAKLKVEVVYAVWMVDIAGRVRRFEFDIPEPKDSEGKIGGPYNLDGVETQAGAGPSTVATELKTVQSSLLDSNDDLRAKAEEYLRINDGRMLTVRVDE